MEIAQLVSLIAALWSSPCEAHEPTKAGRIDIVCQGDVRAQVTPRGDVRVALPSCQATGKVCKLAKVPDGFLELLDKAPRKGKAATKGNAGLDAAASMLGG